MGVARRFRHALQHVPMFNDPSLVEAEYLDDSSALVIRCQLAAIMDGGEIAIDQDSPWLA